MASSQNKSYVSSPTAADYMTMNTKVTKEISSLPKRNHRLISALGDNANRSDGGPNGFKYVEGVLLSTKDVSFSKTDLGMTDVGFLSEAVKKEGAVYNMIRFSRKNNIRSFDFILTYTQVSSYGAKVYKAVPVTKQFKGSFIFTGCSQIRDTTTYEKLPLTMYAKYEYIGGSIGENVDLNSKIDSRGGPAFNFKYTFDNDYVYIYLDAISPFRLIPVGNGEFQDISYAINEGTFTNEVKDSPMETKDAISQIKKEVDFTSDKVIWCDVNLSICDTTISHEKDNIEVVEFDEKLKDENYVLKEDEFSIAPSANGEEVVLGLIPATESNFEAAPDMTPIRFGSRMLSQDKDKVNNIVDKFTKLIRSRAVGVKKLPFTIETVIRIRGKYHIKDEYFIDKDSDAFGKIIVRDVGYYNSETDKFSFTEYIFDKDVPQITTSKTVGEYKKYKNTPSEYFNKLTGGTYSHVEENKTEVLSFLKDINFENPASVDMYFNVAYIKSPNTFKVQSAFAEFGDDDESNEDDTIIYFCEDNKIRLCNFKDYNFQNVEEIDLLSLVEDLSITSKISSVCRTANSTGDGFTYFIGTTEGLIIQIENILSDSRHILSYGAFDKNTSNSETVSYLTSDGMFVYIGGDDGSFTIFNLETSEIDYVPYHFRFGDKVRYVKAIDQSTVLVISNMEACTYNLVSKKWCSELDPYRMRSVFDNPYDGLAKPNIDLILEKNGWAGCSTIQIDDWVYAFGINDDDFPVYKKINVYTGETAILPFPKTEKMLKKASVCREGDIIYFIGGKHFKELAIPSASEAYTHIERFDLSRNVWLTSKDIVLLDGNTRFPINLKTENVVPLAFDKKVYLFRPYCYSYIDDGTGNPGAGNPTAYVDKTVHIIDLSDDSVDPVDDLVLANNAFCVNLDSTLLDDYLGGENTNFTIIPLKEYDDKIYCIFSVSKGANFSFEGYHIFYAYYDVHTSSFKEIKHILKNEKELLSNGKATSLFQDLFSKPFSMYNEYNEAIFYCIDTFILYTFVNSPYAEFHSVYHNLRSSMSDHAPLLPLGDYNAWTRNGKTPNNVSFVHIGNYLVFYGGTSDRVYGYFSLDTLSMIPAPRYSDRDGQSSNTSISNGRELKVVSTKNNFVGEVCGCRVGNYEYLLSVKTTASHGEYKAFVLRHEYDSPSAKIEVIAEVSSILHTQRFEELSNFTLIACGSYIYAIPTVGYISGLKQVISQHLSIFAFNISSLDFSCILSDDIIANGIPSLFVYKKDNNVFVETKDVIRKISETNVFTVTNSTPIFQEYYDRMYGVSCIRGETIGKYLFAVIPEDNSGLSLKRYNFETGVIETIYDIPNSVNFNDSECFISGFDLYVSKGKNDENPSHDLYRFSIGEICKTRLSDIKYGQMVYKTRSDLPIAKGFVPFAISRLGNMYVYGRGLFNNTSKLSDIQLELFTSSVKDNDFIPLYLETYLTNGNRSEDNRLNSTLTSVFVDGHELIYSYGGTRSANLKETKTVDIYDVDRHRWLDAVNISKAISFGKFYKDTIYGGVEYLEDSDTYSPFAKKIKISCTSYENATFSVKESDIDYTPTGKALYVPSIDDESIVYVIKLTETDSLSSEIVTIIGRQSPTNEYVFPSSVVNQNIQIIGAFSHDGRLFVICYNKIRNIAFIMRDVNYVFETLYEVELKQTPVIKNNKALISFYTENDKFAASYKVQKQTEVNNTYGILSYIPSGSEICVKAINVVITISDNFDISSEYKFALANTVSPSSISKFAISKSGKAFFVADENRNIICSFDNTDSEIKYLTDSCTDNGSVIAKCIFENTLFVLLQNGNIVKYNLITNERKTFTVPDGYTSVSFEPSKTIIVPINGANEFAIISIISGQAIILKYSFNGDKIGISQFTEQIDTTNFRAITNISKYGEIKALLDFGSTATVITIKSQDFEISKKDYTTQNVASGNRIAIDEDIENESVVYAFKENDVLKIVNSEGTKFSKITVPNNSEIVNVSNHTIYLVDNNNNVFVIGYDREKLVLINSPFALKKWTQITDLAFNYQGIVDVRHGLFFRNGKENSENPLYNESCVSSLIGNNIVSITKYANTYRISLIKKTTKEVVLDKPLELGNEDIDLKDATIFGQNNSNDLPILIIRPNNGGHIIRIEVDSEILVSVIESNSTISKPFVVSERLPNNTVIIGEKTSPNEYYTIDVSNNAINKVSVDFGTYTGFSLQSIVYCKPYFERYYGFLTKEGSEYLYFGKFSKNNDLIGLFETRIPKEYYPKYLVGEDKLILSDINGNTMFLFKYDETHFEIGQCGVGYIGDSLLSSIQFNNDIKTYSLNYEKNGIELDSGIVVSYDGSDIIITDNERAVKKITKTDSTNDVNLIRVLHWRNYIVIFDTDEIFFFDVISKEFKGSILTSTFDLDSPLTDYDIELLSATPTVFVDERKLFKIVLMKEGEAIQLNYKISESEDIDSFDFTSGSFEKMSSIKYPQVGESGLMVKTQGDTLAFLGNSVDYYITHSDSFENINYIGSTSPNSNIIKTSYRTGDKIVHFADKIFIIRPNSNVGYVIVPSKHGLVDASKNAKELTISLNPECINAIHLLDKVSVGKNDRTAMSKRGINSDHIFAMYCDSIKSSSEYFNKYAGIVYDESNICGSVNNIDVPMSEFEVSNIGVTLPMFGFTSRGNHNVTTLINMIHKSPTKNVIVSIIAISRLDPNFLTKDYETRESYNTGDVAAFTYDNENGLLVRNDSIYNNMNVCSCAIINKNRIKINVDGTSYVYSSSNNSLPFKNEILPVVIAYGSRQNISGNYEERYYSFIDVKGNVSSYDRELKDFIDISGTVPVEIPYFSTEALIIPSEVDVLTPIVKEVLA